MQMEDLSVLAQVSAKEGEHHVPFLFTNQAEHSGKALVTDGRVPGRHLGTMSTPRRLTPQCGKKSTKIQITLATSY